MHSTTVLLNHMSYGKQNSALTWVQCLNSDYIVSLYFPAAPNLKYIYCKLCCIED